MTRLFTETEFLFEEILEMTRLVKIQLTKLKEALLGSNMDLAREITSNEKRVDAQELKVDRDCENILALYNPVAIDLRFVIAALKINANLERIGDNTASIAKYMLHSPSPFDAEMIRGYGIDSMIDVTLEILDITLTSLEKKETEKVRCIFAKDEMLDKINRSAMDRTVNFVQDDATEIRQYLYMVSIVHRLERIGDHAKNIAEEIIFYLEADVLKHSGKKKKH